MTAQLSASQAKALDDLLGQMTLDEKLAQLVGVWVTDLIDKQRRFSPEGAQQHVPLGVGHISRVGGAALLEPAKSAALANDIQRYLTEQTRLKIPAIIHEECCGGYMAREATTFPQAIGQAATWDIDLIQKMADVIRQEMRAVGGHHGLAPVVDIVRDPRWGRIEETYGEDPFLVSAIGMAYIRGLQGADLADGVVATGKHFLGYGWSEGGLNWAPAHIPDRELREIFLTPFKAAIQEAGLASIMNAYHEHDGVPLGSSKALMVDLLRNEVGFDQVVVSDYFTIDMLMNYHHVARDRQEAAVMALQAGIDVELPAVNCYGDPLRAALDAGEISIDLIDTSVRRILAMKFQLGLFENPFVDEGRVSEVFHREADKDLSQQVAEKSLVLLKNDGLLPLPKSLKKVAVIGPSADSIRLLQGDYHYPSHMEGVFNADTNMDAPNPLQDLSSEDVQRHFRPSTSVLAGIKALLGEDSSVRYAKGCEITGADTSGFAEAIRLAEESEVVILVLGDRSGLASHCTTGESIDRASLGLPGVQQQLVEALYVTGTPIALVLLNGRPFSLPWIAEHIHAVLEAWLPAETGGKAIAKALFGELNPGGRLPVSIPRDVGQVPIYYNHKPSGGRSHWQGSYIDMTAEALYPFGHGLSYTRFDYRNLEISPSEVTAQDTVEISFEIENIGDRAGDEVVQLYLNDPLATVTRPVKELKGFTRLHLEAGETKTVRFSVQAAHMGFYNREMCFGVEAGEIKVMIGASSADIRLEGNFEITGQASEVKQVFSTPVSVQ